MVIDSTNQSWLVLRGVETLLETEFDGDTLVYISDEPMTQKRRAFRLNSAPGEQISRIASLTTDRHNIEINLEFPVGSNKRIVKQKAHKLFERAKRVLVNNCAYRPDNAYRWHGGLVEGINYDPDREEVGDEDETNPAEDIVVAFQMIWGVTVSEGLPA